MWVVAGDLSVFLHLGVESLDFLAVGIFSMFACLQVCTFACLIAVCICGSQCTLGGCIEH